MKNLSTFRVIRYLVGYVFLISGLMKFINDFSSVFASMGIPFAEAVVLIVGLTEIICGGMIVLDYYTKQATIPLLIIIIGAILIDKVPSLHEGFFIFLFKARLDVVVFTLLFVIWQKK